MARSAARPPIPKKREVRFMLCPREGGEVSSAEMIAGRPGGIKAGRRNGRFGDGEPGRGGGLGDAAGGERGGGEAIVPPPLPVSVCESLHFCRDFGKDRGQMKAYHAFICPRGGINCPRPPPGHGARACTSPARGGS